MANQKNRFGLSRYIPDDVRREVRRRCGFGCVICGKAFYDYEHFNPDFKDATIHDPKGMTLLCSQCNQKRARGRLSAETVSKANENPKCLEDGFSSELFDFSDQPITVYFAGVEFYDCKNIIVVNDYPILSISPPDKPGRPILLSGTFTNENGKEVISIVDNAFALNIENWDVECEGGTITVRSASRRISLVLSLSPPSAIAIERIEMLFHGVYFRGNRTTLEISTDGKGWNSFSACSVHRCETGILIDNGISPAANDRFY